MFSQLFTLFALLRHWHVLWCVLGLCACTLGPAARLAHADPSEPPSQNAAASTSELVAVPEPTPSAVAFHESGNRLWLAGRAWSLLVPAVWLLSGAAARLWRFVVLLTRPWLIRVGSFALAYYLITALINMPWSIYLGFMRLHDYGLSTQSLADWGLDWLKSLAVAQVVFAPVVVGLYFIMERSPKRWWLYCGLLSLPLMLFTAFVMPIWVDPLFNDFGPMRDKALEARILELGARAGVDADRVYEVDKSRETRTVNAYVTGLLDTKRIVLWDTLTDRLSDDEVLAVMAHELGHYAMNHLIQGVLAGALLTLLGFWIVHQIASRVLPRLPPRTEVTSLAQPASLPLVALLAQAVALVLTPPGYAFSRHLEREADRFALEMTRDNHAAARAFVSLQRENLGYPRPGLLYSLWRATHPSLGERIDFCNTYRPWEQGKPLRYGHLIHAHPGPPRQSSDTS